MNRTHNAAVLAVILASLAGCGGGEEEQAQQAPPPRPVVEQPREVRVASLITDDRVQFPQAHAPTDEALARAIVSLAGALAAGDEAVLRPLLDASGQGVLDQLLASGRWSEATGEIQAVRIVSLEQGEEGALVGVAVQTTREAYLTGWRAVRAGGGWVFGATPTPDTTAPTAADLDGASLSN